MADTQVEEKTYTLDEILTVVNRNHRLILWNDDTNTFEHVIHCLIKYLDYTDSQAEKIAWIVHTKGKCTVLEGTWTEIEVYRKILKHEGLSVTNE
ncbi:ATP-dependent Clp protease adaptor ClpS [Albibacterium bauzanense]|uniref:ATP-dependent Clp protease adaptor protein ClpS n=1 Tax=Albibacterium bauzanense TaxID=653929 RepID=A0A4V2PXQ9_9SPHI|nr:ATP-dependent Clp protease adaptor ClpS [Albibacterium bauzanense]TCK83081.1 ATP-dependent Clp protease adaptor protein ClpS [Albibacterium bauzanense]